MGGSTKQTTTATSSTSPYGPAAGSINSILAALNSKIPGSELTANENSALNTLTENAQAGNPFAGSINDFATNLLNGGNAMGQAGNISGSLTDYQRRLGGIADGQNIGPNGNPALKGYLDTISSDVQNRVNGMFAGAGRDLSGANVGTLARGIAEGTAPILAQQYNTDFNNMRSAADALYGAGNTTSGLLTGLNQQDLANRQAGVDASSAALQARDSGAQRLLEIEAQRRGIPVQNLGNILGMVSPVGQAFGTTNSQQTSSTQVPLGQQILGGALGGLGLLGQLGGFGSGGWLYGTGGSGLLGGLFGK